MPASRTSARGYPPAFSRKEQSVALRKGSEARSRPLSRRLRLASHAALAPLGDFLVRVRPILSLFAASLIAFAPFNAMAQDQQESVSVRDRPRPEYDPLGKRFGGFNLHAALDLGATYTDNLFAEETGEDEDTIYTAGLRGRLESNWSRHALAFEAGGTTLSHDEFSTEDHDTYYGGAAGRLDIGSSSNVSARARLSHEAEARNDPDAPAQGIPLAEFDRTDMSISAQHRFNRFRVAGTVGQIEQEYDGTQSFRDYDETRLTGRVEAEVSPRIGLMLEATTDERDYDNTPALSSEGTTYLVGATINFTDLMQGHVAVGQFEREYDSGDSTDGLAVSAALEWYITRLTTFTLNAHRNSEENVGATTAAPFVESEYGARIDHELLRNVILTGGVQFGRREYETIDRDDEYVFAEVGADWLINRHLVARGRFMHDEVESDGVNAYRDYEESRFTLGLGIHL
jgi:hypothetical protein